jgi:hypothetical protein
MKARIDPILAAIGGAFTLVVLALAAPALAGPGCNCGSPPPPPCCAPPTPPSPPSHPCCAPPGFNVNIPGVNVNVGASVIVNANVNAQASVVGGAGGAVFFGGGGGGGGYLAGGTPGLIQGLNVEGGLRRTGYEATRTKMTRVVIEAVCLDDKGVPHPASQVTPDRDIDDSYDGELYRCIAGTRLQYTWAEFDGHVAFDHGTTITCEKGDALYHSPGGPAGPGGPGMGGPGGAAGGGGALSCRPQKPARDCNERSLLRRFGAGVKVLTMLTVEKYTAYREETTSGSTTTALSLDGGVGGVMY